MTEFLGLAVMAEVPVVLINSQRGGPSTGLPTKTEQSDLNLAIHGGSGDSPRPVIAATSVSECYELTIKAFEVAEAFQTPVILLLDLFLSNRMEDITWPAGELTTFGKYAEVRADAPADGGEYRRFALTETGVSPRAIPGTPGLYHAVTGLEQTAKRHRKLETLLERWPAPTPEGDSGELDIGIVSWGSSVGAAQEAIGQLRAAGLKAAGLFPRLLWPLHAEPLRELSARARCLLVAEANYTGQFAALVRQALAREVIGVGRVPAEPLASSLIVQAAREALE